jgi:NADH-quinone oxidoreductase subunit F
MYERLERGQATQEEIETLLDLSDNILGRAFCALGDGATSPITSSIKYFREDYLAHFEQGGCPFDPMASTVFSVGGATP